SWPAFSHCSADGVIGDGTAASGDSLGTLNGYMEWDPAVTDTPNAWGVKLSTRALTTQWGPLAAPESLRVDVTPRRTQQFRPSPGTVVQGSARRLSDGAIVQRDSVVAAALGLVTLPQVRVQRTGTVLAVFTSASVTAAPPPAGQAVLALAPLANPAHGSLV